MRRMCLFSVYIQCRSRCHSCICMPSNFKPNAAYVGIRRHQKLSSFIQKQNGQKTLKNEAKYYFHFSFLFILFVYCSFDYYPFTKANHSTHFFFFFFSFCKSKTNQAHFYPCLRHRFVC